MSSIRPVMSLFSDGADPTRSEGTGTSRCPRETLFTLPLGEGDLSCRVGSHVSYLRSGHQADGPGSTPLVGRVESPSGVLGYSVEGTIEGTVPSCTVPSRCTRSPHLKTESLPRDSGDVLPRQGLPRFIGTPVPSSCLLLCLAPGPEVRVLRLRRARGRSRPVVVGHTGVESGAWFLPTQSP